MVGLPPDRHADHRCLCETVASLRGAWRPEVLCIAVQRVIGFRGQCVSRNLSGCIVQYHGDGLPGRHQNQCCHARCKCVANSACGLNAHLDLQYHGWIYRPRDFRCCAIGCGSYFVAGNRGHGTISVYLKALERRESPLLKPVSTVEMV